MEQYTGKKIMTFRDRFDELCNEESMNTTSLANALHVSKQTVSAWRIGTRSPKQPTVQSIADYFGVSVGWLMGYDVKRENEELKNRTISIVVPDSDRFVKLVHYMSTADYVMVMQAFERAEKKLKEEEEKNG